MPQPPLLCEEGNIPHSTFLQFIHTFYDRPRSLAFDIVGGHRPPLELGRSTTAARPRQVRGSRRQRVVKYWPRAVNSCILNPKNICHWEAYEARLPWIHLCPVVGCMGAASSQSST